MLRCVVHPAGFLHGGQTPIPPQPGGRLYMVSDEPERCVDEMLFTVCYDPATGLALILFTWDATDTAFTRVIHGWQLLAICLQHNIPCSFNWVRRDG